MACSIKINSQFLKWDKCKKALFDLGKRIIYLYYCYGWARLSSAYSIPSE